jgi:hypothetical protein
VTPLVTAGSLDLGHVLERQRIEEFPENAARQTQFGLRLTW